MNPLLFNPWFLLSAGVSVLVLVGGSFYEGYHIASNSYQVKLDQKDMDWQKRIDQLRSQAELVADAEQQQAQDAATSYEKGRAQAKVVYQTITNTVDHVIHDNPTVYTGTCFDASGLLAANAALTAITAGTPQAPSTGPRSILPQPDATNRRSSGNGVTEANGGR